MRTNKELWQAECAAVLGQATVDVLTEIRDGQRTLVSKVDAMSAAFPGGDTDGHRRYHEAVIERIELRNKLIREALIKVAQAGAVAGAGWLLLAAWEAFKLNARQ